MSVPTYSVRINEKLNRTLHDNDTIITEYDQLMISSLKKNMKKKNLNNSILKIFIIAGSLHYIVEYSSGLH